MRPAKGVTFAGLAFASVDTDSPSIGLGGSRCYDPRDDLRGGVPTSVRCEPGNEAAGAG